MAPILWTCALGLLPSAAAAGEVRTVALADMVAAMPAGTWYEIPNTRLADVFPPKEGHPAWGTLGADCVTIWGGGVFDRQRNVLTIHGGGHKCYGGNEVYEFDVASLTWRRVTDPAPYRRIEVAEGDVRFESLDPNVPVAVHPYDGIEMDRTAGKWVRWGGSHYSIQGGTYDNHPYVYDPASRSWRRGSPPPRKTGLVVSSGYDPKNGWVVFEHGNGLQAYDVDTDTWTMLDRNSNGEKGSAAAVDPDRRLFIETAWKSRGTILYYDLDKPAEGRRRAPLTVDDGGYDIPDRERAGWGHESPGIAYHPGSRTMKIWNGGRTVWTLDPDSWLLSAHQPDRGPEACCRGDESKTFGSSGRWRYVPALDVFIAYEYSRDNVWLYKPRSSRPEVAAGRLYPVSASTGAVRVEVRQQPEAGPNGTWGMRHSRIVFGNGSLYWFGGDYAVTSHDLPGSSAGHQELWRYDLPDNRMTLVADYCADPVPWHPDGVGFTWDTKRGVFWYVPGLQHPHDKNPCPDVAVKDHVLYFDPETGKWVVPEGQTPVQKAHGRFAHYDAATDKIWALAGSVAWAFDPETGAWMRYKTGLPSAQSWNEYSALEGRRIVGLDDQTDELVYFDIDRKSAGVLSRLPFDMVNDWAFIVNTPRGLVVHDYSPRNGTPSTWLYRDGRWERLVLKSPNGFEPRGSNMAYHPEMDVVLLFGIDPNAKQGYPMKDIYLLHWE